MKKLAKHFMLVMCVVMASALLSGCGNKAAQDEIIKYINVETVELHKLDKIVVDSQSSVIGDNYQNDMITFEELKNTTLPASVNLVKKAGEIRITNEDLRNVHNIFIKAVRTRHDGLSLQMAAITAQDVSKMVEANKYIAESIDLVKEYEQKLKELGKKYDVVVKLEYQN